MTRRSYRDPLMAERLGQRLYERECAECGHQLGEHRELDRDDERYAPAVFYCRICGCSLDRREGR